MAKVKSQYTERDKFKLICDAIGTPGPTVTWHKGKDIYLGHRSNETITPGRYDYEIYFNGVDIKDKHMRSEKLIWYFVSFIRL